MSTGIEFLGDKISKSYSETITTDTERTYAYNIEVDYSVQCTEQAGQAGVGLWQWVTSTHDGQASVLSLHTVCRYGALYDKSPECPWNACEGDSADCSQCASDWKTQQVSI